MPGVDDLETLYPEVAKGWDYERNIDILPSQIRPNANKKFYFICSTCGKSYLAYPRNRINGHCCRECRGERISKTKSKKVGQYDESGLLINTYQGLHQAAKAMQVVPNAIFQAIKNGGKSKGFYWRYILNEDNE